MQWFPRRILRNVACVSIIGLLLASCSSSTAQLTKSERLQRENSACKQIGTPPKLSKGNPSKATIVFVRASLISALDTSDNASLKKIGRDLTAATKEESKSGSGAPVVRVLDRGVAACHHLGLSTTS